MPRDFQAKRRKNFKRRIKSRKIWRRFKNNKIREDKRYSLMNIMKEKGTINDDFISRLADISLEDVIALKLESTARLMGGRFWAVPVISGLREICEESIFKFVLSCSRDTQAAITSLGLTQEKFLGLKFRYEKKWKLEEFEVLDDLGEGFSDEKEAEESISSK